MADQEETALLSEEDADGYGKGGTLHGAPCPGWPPGKECEYGTEHISLYPYVDQSDPRRPRIRHAHTVAVCDECYRAQYQQLYGITPEEAPGLAPPDPPKRKMAPRKSV